MRHATELSWNVHGLRLNGLSWGDVGQRPLLMLHGWLDNAASFALLAPLLKDFHVVALDLTGHGRSDRRSADATYQIWDDLPEVMGVLDQLGWTQFDLLGHSRGAIISTLLASAFPERVRHVVLLDAIFPQAVNESEFAGQMRKFLDQKTRFLEAENRVFASQVEAIEQRTRGGLGSEAAALLVERGIKDCESGVTWTTDRRLHSASAVKLTPGQIRAVLEALSMPVLLVLDDDGDMASLQGFRETLDCCPDLLIEFMSGGHHFHMIPPLEPMADRVSQFFLQENV